MSYDAKQFAAELALNGKTFYAYPNVKAELTLMSTAVKADLTTHDRTIQSALGILQNPATNYQAQIVRLINKAKAGNLPVATMGAAMDAVVAAMP